MYTIWVVVDLLTLKLLFLVWDIQDSQDLCCASHFCNSGNKYKVAITCTFGRRLRMSTINAVPTCTANTHVRANRRKYRVLGYLICIWMENAANSVYLCVFSAHFSPAL